MTLTWSWIALVVAGLFEVCWAIGLKYTNGFTKIIPSFFTILAMILSVYLLAYASKALPIGTAYAVWVGIGALGASIFGIILFNEPATFLRITFLGLLVIAILGLKLSA